MVIISNSVQAGDAIQENPTQAIPALNISPTIDGYEFPEG
jgi:hypothetical protein